MLDRSLESRNMKAVVKFCHHQMKARWLSIIFILTLSIDEIKEEWHQPSKKLTPTSTQTLSEADGVTPPVEGSEVKSKPSHLLADKHSILQPEHHSQFSIHMASEEVKSGGCFIILVPFVDYFINCIDQ